MKTNWKKEIRPTGMLILLFGITIIIIALSSRGMEYINTHKKFAVGSILYLAVFIALIFLKVKFDRSKFVHFLFRTWYFPLELIALIFFLVEPIYNFLISIFFYFMTVMFVPLAIDIFSFIISGYHLPHNTLIYVLLTTVSIISLRYSTKVLNIVRWFFKKFTRHQDDKIRTTTEYVVNKKNIRFIIYAAYFIYLLFYSFNAINGKEFLGDKGFNQVVLQSFYTILAYDSLSANAQGIRLLPSKLFRHFMDAYRNELKKFRTDKP
jgi:hypothetical protein